MPTLLFEVAEVRGKCPVYKVGDRIVIEGPRIDLERTDNLCIHALPSTASPSWHSFLILPPGNLP